MSIRGPRLEFAVGAFLLLALATLLVLAFASTNSQFGFSGGSYPLKARFTSIGQLRVNGPVKIGGVTIGRVASIQVDPVKYDSVVTLAIEDTFKDLPADTSAGVYTSGLLGEAYIGLQPGGDPETLQPGEEIAFTQPAVDLLQLAGKYMFGGGAPGDNASTDAATPHSDSHMEPAQ
ncbi:MAG: outer membrane lipid asymmetry maintenance protein MlaD [Pseudomonadota bacterium]|nr:outer membrane lipid asymmetry maintenance protein MlaD [Pseudomonadota bacterium]